MAILIFYSSIIVPKPWKYGERRITQCKQYANRLQKVSLDACFFLNSSNSEPYTTAWKKNYIVHVPLSSCTNSIHGTSQDLLSSENQHMYNNHDRRPCRMNWRGRRVEGRWCASGQWTDGVLHASALAHQNRHLYLLIKWRFRWPCTGLGEGSAHRSIDLQADPSRNWCAYTIPCV